MSIPIFNNFRVRNKVRTAKIQQSNQELQLRRAKQALYKEICQAWNGANAARSKYEASIEAESAAADAFELTHREGVEYMRTKYCLRHELGMCPKLSSPACRDISNSSLYLHNNGRTLTLEFHCRECEMTVK